MVYADLHVHTRRSDGELAVGEVPAAARDAGVSVVALTDHDRLPAFDDPVVEREGVTVVSGIELRVEAADGQRVDLLGYGVRRTDALADLVERIQRNRRERGRAIVECVEDRLGIDLDVTVEAGFGRPHAARAIDRHPDSGHDYQGAFDTLIGNGCPCYRAREIPAFGEGRRVLAEAATLVSLAHPLRYDDSARALQLAGDLDAVERNYPYADEVDLDPVDRAIERAGLLATGGSDAHGTTLGAAGLDRAAYRALSIPP